MIKDLNLLKDNIQTKRLYNNVKSISTHHRIQATQGYRDAANYCLHEFEKAKIDARILTFPANATSWYHNRKSFQEWTCEEAYLEICSSNFRIADFAVEPISIIQRSYPCDYKEGIDLVYLKHGTNFEAYDDLDLKGKMVFVRGHYSEYLCWAVKEKGAVGIVTDFVDVTAGVRNRNDLYQALTYTSFWWTHTEADIPCFGFVLSPQMGDYLAEQFENNSSIKCNAKVIADFKDGSLDIVEAVIPGELEEEVIVCAHLCHPKSSCNDNASGVSCAIEVMSVLNQLIQNKKIPTLKRTLKAILVPEFSGTYAYLTQAENYQNCIGAINLDMVGGKQTRYYGPITLTETPRSIPSMVDDLTKLCLDIAGREAPNHGGDEVAKTNYTISKFSGGSDHTLFSDPTIGVPCCMIGQWPDLFYHTSKDDMSVIDPEVLAFSTRTALYFSYLLANKNANTGLAIFNQMQSTLSNKLNHISHALRNKVISKNMAYFEIKHHESYFLSSVEQALSWDINEQEIIAMKTWIIETCLQMIRFLDLDKPNIPKTNLIVYQRNYKTPLMRLRDFVSTRPQLLQYVIEYEQFVQQNKLAAKEYVWGLNLTYYIDGINDVEQLIIKTSADAQENTEAFVKAYLSLLLSLELISIV